MKPVPISTHAFPSFKPGSAPRKLCRHYLVACRWPDGYQLPTLRRQFRIRGVVARSVAVQVMPASDLGHRRHGPAPHRAFRFARGSPAAHLRPRTRLVFSAVQLQRQLGLARLTRRPGRCCELRFSRDAAIERDRISARWRSTVMSKGVESGAAADASDSTKSIVAGAVEVATVPVGSGHVVEDLSASSPTTFVETSVEPGSTVLTDGWWVYARLAHEL